MCHWIGSFETGGNLGGPGPYKGSECPPHKRNPHSHVKEPPWNRLLRKLDTRYMIVHTDIVKYISSFKAQYAMWTPS